MNGIIDDMGQNLSWLQHRLRGDPEAAQRPPAELIGLEEAIRQREACEQELREQLRHEQIQREHLERVKQQQEQEIRQLRGREQLAREVYAGTVYTGMNSSSPIFQEEVNQNTRPVDTTTRPLRNLHHCQGNNFQTIDQQDRYPECTPGNTYRITPQANYPGNFSENHQSRIPGGDFTRLNSNYRLSQNAFNRWREIKDSIQMSGICFPQPGVTANDFLNSLEARARREEWNEAEMLKVISLTLKGTAARWVDSN